jgi:outer membrane murein-binding lipoprotein Lpp
MPSSNSSNADLNQDAEMLTTAVEVNASLLPGLDELTAPLKETLTEIKTLTTRQETLKADKQKITQDLKAARARLRDQKIQLRAAIKGKLGPRTEKLVEFKVQPLRKRSRAAKPEPFVPAAASDNTARK